MYKHTKIQLDFVVLQVLSTFKKWKKVLSHFSLMGLLGNMIADLILSSIYLG